MRTDDFDFDLPRDLIAQRPVEPRDQARLLDVGDGLVDRRIADLPDVLRSGDLLIVNDTRVIPARLTGRRGSVKIEVTLHKRLSADTWLAFAKPARRLHVDDRVDFAPETPGAFQAEVAEKGDGGEVTLRLGAHDGNIMAALRRYGAAPLPPYIRRESGPDARDSGDYQTVFAAHDGAVAAPTAGLHFTESLLEALAQHGICRIALTLHVGSGTFLPVKVDDPHDHVLHAEAGEITPEAAEAVNAARQAGGRIVAVGTTALRLLESAADSKGRVHPFKGDTELFILPGYRFRVVDLLLTNFHLPRSTLYMLAAAFVGLERIRRAYSHAVQAGYRFYSYGDACLLHRREAA